MGEWMRGARSHPGWIPATMFCLVCFIASGGTERPWAGFFGFLFYLPVIFTCRSVARANKGR